MSSSERTEQDSCANHDEFEPGCWDCEIADFANTLEEHQ